MHAAGTNGHQTPTVLRKLVTEEDRPFGIGVTFETLQRRGARTSAVLFRNGGSIPNGSVPPQGSKSNKRRLASPDLKAKVIRLGD